MKALFRAAFVAGLLVAVFPVFAQVTIVDIVPNSMNTESDQNSEPSIAVNPANPNQILVDAFGDSSPDPIFLTTNGGTSTTSWSTLQTGTVSDQSLAWSPGGSAYHARLAGSTGSRMEVQRSTDTAGGIQFSTITAGTLTGNPDQPWMEVSQVGSIDHLYVGFNDLNQNTNTASIRYSTNGGTSWTNTVIEHVTPPAGQDGPPIRVAVNGSVVYGAFDRYTGTVTNSADAISDIVVVRDDNAGANGFNALGTAGVTVAASRRIPSSDTGTNSNGTSLGHERIGADLSLAVDPNNSSRLVLSWAQVQNGESHLHIAVSGNGGLTWNDLLQVGSASALPALAIAGNGTIGLLYTALVSGKLETHFLQTSDTFATTSDSLLAKFTDNNPALSFDPYIGDYEQVKAVGNNFYGTFCASNDTSLFSQQPIFERNAALLGNSVAFSIDPYFFTSAAIPEPGVMALAAAAGASLLASRARRRRGAPPQLTSRRRIA